MSFHELKKTVFRLLVSSDFQKSLDEIHRLPPKQVVNPLFSFFHNRNELVKWRAVTTMGEVVSKLAGQEKEAARIVMRRLIWNLNDESGGIGWGSPEAMGEIMARDAGMAHEYHKILISYIIPEMNYLEHEILQRGVLWGVGRLAHKRPEMMKSSAHYLIPFMNSPDPFHRGLAAWIAVLFNNPVINNLLKGMRDDQAVFTFYTDGLLKEVTVSSIACLAIASNLH
jgi:hypothetical protein